MKTEQQARSNSEPAKHAHFGKDKRTSEFKASRAQSQQGRTITTDTRYQPLYRMKDRFYRTLIPTIPCRRYFSDLSDIYMFI